MCLPLTARRLVWGFSGRGLKEILSPQHNGVSATLPAPARWPGRHAKRLRPPRAPHGHGSTNGKHPSRREHATVLVGVLCAINGTQHQQRHKHTTHSSEQPIFGSLARARTRNDAWDHASPIVHARLATHRPHLPSKAQHCTMSSKTLYSPPYIAASQHIRERPARAMRHGPAHASASSESGHTAHAAARQRQSFAARRTRKIPSLPRAPSTNLHACN